MTAERGHFERPAILRPVGRIDVDAMGVLSDLQVVGRCLAPTWPRRYQGPRSLPSPSRGWRRQGVAWGLRRLRRSVTRRSAWHGYHAEPYVMPPGVERIGTGWTRRRALRSLARYVAEAQR